MMRRHEETEGGEDEEQTGSSGGQTDLLAVEEEELRFRPEVRRADGQLTNHTPASFTQIQPVRILNITTATRLTVNNRFSH